MTWLEVLLAQPLQVKDSYCGYGLLLLGAQEGLLPQNQVFHTVYPTARTLIGLDAFGGLFALCDSQQTVHYFAPDTLAWEDLELPYSHFLEWAQSDRLALFYEAFWFSGAEPMAEQVKAGLAISSYPPLWSAEYGPETASRGLVPLQELLSLNADWASALGNK